VKLAADVQHAEAVISVNIVAANSVPFSPVGAAGQGSVIDPSPQSDGGAKFSDAMQNAGCQPASGAPDSADEATEGNTANDDSTSASTEKSGARQQAVAPKTANAAEKSVKPKKAERHAGQHDGKSAVKTRNGQDVAGTVSTSDTAATPQAVPTLKAERSASGVVPSSVPAANTSAGNDSKIAAVDKTAVSGTVKVTTQRAAEGSTAASPANADVEEGTPAHATQWLAAGEADRTTPRNEDISAAGFARDTAVQSGTALRAAPAAREVGANTAAANAGAQAHELTMNRFDSATPNKIEVGLSGGSMGWLNVRAELRGDSTVHAMLRGPAETAGTLKAQASDLEGFLQAHSVSVKEISIESGKVAPAAQSFHFADSKSDAQDGTAMGQGFSGEERKRQQDNTFPGATTSAKVEAEGAVVSVPLFAAMQSGMQVAGTGSWLSVRV
jgi:hypothetical protein